MLGEQLMSALREVQKEELGLEGTKMQERVHEVVAWVVLVKQLSTQYWKFIVLKKNDLWIFWFRKFSAQACSTTNLSLSLCLVPYQHLSKI